MPWSSNMADAGRPSHLCNCGVIRWIGRDAYNISSTTRLLVNPSQALVSHQEAHSIASTFSTNMTSPSLVMYRQIYNTYNSQRNSCELKLFLNCLLPYTQAHFWTGQSRSAWILASSLISYHQYLSYYVYFLLVNFLTGHVWSSYCFRLSHSSSSPVLCRKEWYLYLPKT